MKKTLMVAFALLATVCTMNAQVAETIQKSKERAEKLQKLCDGYKTCGNGNIDGFGDAVKGAAVFAIENSVQLENMYKRQIGESVDGVTDVTVTKPTLDEWITFATTVFGEGAKLKEATDKAKAAGEEAKSIAENAKNEKNPMKAGKAAKMAKGAAAVVTFGNEATVILGEETAAQAKAVNEIIETLKSGKNL